MTIAALAELLARLSALACDYQDDALDSMAAGMTDAARHAEGLISGRRERCRAYAASANRRAARSRQKLDAALKDYASSSKASGYVMRREADRSMTSSKFVRP